MSGSPKLRFVQICVTFTLGKEVFVLHVELWNPSEDKQFHTKPPYAFQNITTYSLANMNLPFLSGRDNAIMKATPCSKYFEVQIEKMDKWCIGKHKYKKGKWLDKAHVISQC